MSVRKKIKNIDFAFRQVTENYFSLEIYRPKSNALGYTKFIQVDNNNHPMNKKEMKQLVEFINRFLLGPQC